MSNIQKPLLIIGCSDAKLDKAAKAFDLYQGGIFKMLRSNLENPLEHFSVLILSAEHGLIDADTVIEPYNTRMCSRKKTNEVAKFAEEHGKAALKKIRSFSGARKLFVALTNDYLEAFNTILGTRKETILNSFQSTYISEGHQGIGDLRGRLARIIKNVVAETEFNPVLFRSGVANFSELGYVAAGCDIGTSLAHVNSQKATDLFSVILDSAKTNKVFIDNGIITAAKNGKDIDTDWVMAEFERIVFSVKPNVAKNISVVIPDDVFCNDRAVAIVKQYKKQIKKLARRCDVILPIHRSEDIRAHALRMMKELNYDSNIRLGVPCLKQKDLDFILPLKDIDAILSLKKPKTAKEEEMKIADQPLFSKIHFFGLSDATAKKKLAPRLLLAELHGVDTMLDCCRTPALFGKNKNGLRKGSERAEQIKDEFLKPKVCSHEDYINHDYKEEHLVPDNSPVFTTDIYDLVNEEGIFDFIAVYNEIMSGDFALSMPQFEKGEESEAVEVAWNLISQPLVRNKIFEGAKAINWNKFQSVIDKCDHMEGSEARFNAIRDIFLELKSETKAQPVQMPLRLAA
ncbi:DUF6884 domain-containing protein [Vibrio sp. D431a]|uniref:DUF6884 domain-containing protein n=1 Tax=Vibrio sp. D431a TaxID=2837388 RepID=UPI002554F075|nr:DUF6884 domain-containing protein [Vibrio sp. D431a]MDK9793697.1 hypothetical protein [Vibrio sp. D431a]